MTQPSKIQIRRGFENQWASANPTLASGEIGLTNTGRIKIGDGTTAWNDLNYVTFDGGCIDCESPPPPPPPLPPPPLPPTCPAPWMNILMHDGTLTPAGELKVGDLVKTTHEETMEWGEYKVVAVSTFASDRLAIVVDGKEFVCSPSHKFWGGDGWITASEIKKGSRIDGKTATEISQYEYGDVVKITVDEAHTYVCEGILCHNKSQLFTTAPPLGTTIPPATTIPPP